ncbi:hypothetical protein ACFL5Z_11040 [Planctomycetota bacterium]
MFYKPSKQIPLGMFAALLFIAMPVHAIENFKVSEHGGGHQIWFEAEAFDQRNPEGEQYYPVVDADGAFGQAITRSGGAGGMIRWTFDISRAGGKGSTWYFWARVLNPSNQSDYMLVEGDPGDAEIPDGPPFPGGDGTAPFDNDDDRIFEADVGPPWGWWGNNEGSDKELQDGENTMYIFHRQGNDTVFWDVFMWADSASYVPNDADYQSAVIPPPPTSASKPSPADGSIFLDTWATLAWFPGETAASHDVYFGENFDDVNDGTGDTFQGNQPGTFFIVGFPGFAYPDGLVPGTTYYWRIDEVEADGTTKYKGNVWSFTVPPKKAYNPNPADRAELVDLEPTLRWTPGFGAKLHTVYLGEDYDTVANAVGGMPQGFGTYSPGPLKMAKTYYWRVDEFDGFATYQGDVWSFTTLGAVSGPNPADGAVNVKTSQILTWTAGGVAASHEVYFGMDEATVANATKASPEYKGSKALGDESYDPGMLTLSTTYYWRIDEVNDVNPDSPWIGNVWSFTTGDFFVVEDFEGYTDNDTDGEAIWQHWIDGFGVPGNGSQVGYLLPPYAEQTIVNSGSQSMPLIYNNIDGVTNSEAALTLTSPRDWTEEGVAELSLWFHGLPASVGSFVEGPAGTYTITATGADIYGTADEFHYAYKTLTGGGSVEAKVLNVQNTDPWAKAGVMIRETLDAGSKFAAVYIMPTNPDGTPTEGCRFQARTDTDIGATSDTPVATAEQRAIVAPYWVKLERSVGGAFRGYYSSDGATWQSMAWNPQSITMNSTVYVGLALTSHNNNTVCEAKFSNVRTTGTVSGQWANQDIGIVSNAAEPLYVAVSNTAGSPAVVANDDPLAATIDAWTEWRIPLQAFADQGINLGNVDKIAVGLGSKGGAAVGGSGTMYIDDLRLYRP